MSRILWRSRSTQCALGATLCTALAFLLPWPSEGARDVRLFLVLDLSRSHGGADALLSQVLPALGDLESTEEIVETQLLGWASSMRRLARTAGPPGQDLIDQARSSLQGLESRWFDRTNVRPLTDGIRLIEPGDAVARVLIWSDGRFFAGAEDSITSLGDGNTSIRYHGRLLPELEDLRIRWVGPLTPLPPDATTRIRMAVEGRVASPREVRVTLGSQSVRLAVGPHGPREFQLDLDVPDDVPSITVAIADPGGPDADPANNTLSIPVRDVSALKVAVAGADVPRARDLLRSMPSVEIVEVDQGLPADVQTIVLADAALLSTDGASELLQEEILNAVQGGAGLVVFGGPHAYRLGGYEKSRLGNALPLSSRRPEQREIHVFLDRSGSMDKDQRFAVAVAATRHLAQALGDRDTIQVHPFGDGLDQAIPRAPVGPDGFLGEPAMTLARIQPTGGTRLASLVRGLPDQAVGKGYELVVLILSDLDDPELSGPDGDQAVRQLQEKLTGMKGQVHLLLLDAQDQTRALARALNVPTRELDSIAPRTLLEAHEQDAWVETATMARWVREPLGSAETWEVSGRNAVTLSEQGILRLSGENAEPLLATGSLGLGRMAACALRLGAPPSGELLAALLEAVRPDEEGIWMVSPGAEGPVIHAPLGVQGPLRLRSGDEEMDLFEVAPGRWVGPPGTPPRGTISSGDEMLARVSGIQVVDPEYQHSPLGLRSGDSDAVFPADARRPLRWPWLLLATVLAAAWAVYARS